MRRGFTLVEIIISIALLVAIGIGSTMTIITVNKKSEEKELKQIYENFDNALQIYLSSNTDVLNNIDNYVEGAVITLDLLKDEGLIESDIIDPTTNTVIDYTKNYYVLSDAVQLKNESEEIINTECANQVSISVIRSWVLNDTSINVDDVLYICPKKQLDEVNNLKDKIDELASELEKVKSQQSGGLAGDDVKDQLKVNTLFEDLTYTAKGINPNNYVEFPVNSDSSKFAYFPNTSDKNLWRILTIDVDGKIKLFYPNAVKSNNYSNYTTDSSTWCDAGYEVNASCTFYKLKHASESSSVYYRYTSSDGFVASEVLEDVNVSGSKKEALYTAIVNKNWIVTEKYFPYYTISSSGTDLKLNSSDSLKLKMGMLNPNEINASINISDSWLYNYSTTLGSFDKSVSFEYYYLYAYNNAGTITYGTRKRMANRCTNSSCSKDRDSSSHWNLYTYSYNPVITLSEKVDLIEPNCADGVVKGSKECPYKLECSDC